MSTEQNLVMEAMSQAEMEASLNQSNIEGTSGMNNVEMENEDAGVDWQRVGRLYKPESAIDHIVNKEMTRLKQAFETKIHSQDTELEEKFKNPKKK